MMRRLLILTMMAALAWGLALADSDWLHIYHNGGKINTGKLTELKRVTFVPVEESDTLFQTMSVEREGVADFAVEMAAVDSVVIGTNVPTIYIDVEGGAEIKSKEEYLNARIRVEGYGAWEDFEEADVLIKGRGNSTWGYPKKPYRLKFEKKQSLCGLHKAKSYALIANFIDCSLMRNAIALKIAELLDMPYTNHSIPVNVVVNGKYRGAYMLTEKIGITGASVDIDETEGVLLELDKNYDEPYQFKSEKFNVPVMIKDPDLEELCAAHPELGTPEENLAKWQARFNALEATLSSTGAPTAEFEELMDMESLAKYMLVFNFSLNREIGHPKSAYMYAESVEDKFHMGPVWDFDWCFTFTMTGAERNPEWYLLSGTQSGNQFFMAMCRSPKFQECYAREWANFKENLYPELLEYVDEYAKQIEVSAYQNGELWPAGEFNSCTLYCSKEYAAHLQAIKSWMEKRMAFMSKAKNWGLMK